MTREKNNFSTDYIIRNIEDQARQRNLIDGATQAPLWFNNPPPMIRGSDRNAGSFVGKEPEKFTFPVSLIPYSSNVVLSLNADIVDGSGRPIDQGSYNKGALTVSTGTPTHLPTSGPGGLACWDLDQGDSYTTSAPGAITAPDGYTCAVIVSNYETDNFERSFLFLNDDGTSNQGAGNVIDGRVATNSPYELTENASSVRIDSPHNQSDGNWTLWIFSDTKTVGSFHDAATFNLGSITATATGNGTGWPGSDWGDGLTIGKSNTTSAASVRLAQLRIWDIKIDSSEFVDIAQFFKDHYNL